MIVFDTETTGLIQPEAMPLNKQPQIIEFAAIKLCDKTLEEVDRIDFLCNPGKPLDNKIVEITKITDADLAGKEPFAARYKELVDFFIGERVLLAHNLGFDRSMLRIELQRLGKVTQFPWPPEHLCSVELTYPIKGHRLSLSVLYSMVSKWEIKGAHRAMNDVEALARIVKWLRKKELIK